MKRRSALIGLCGEAIATNDIVGGVQVKVERVVGGVPERVRPDDVLRYRIKLYVKGQRDCDNFVCARYKTCLHNVCGTIGDCDCYEKPSSEVLEILEEVKAEVMNKIETNMTSA